MKKKRIEYAVQFKMRAGDGILTDWVGGETGYELKQLAWHYFTKGFLAMNGRIQRGVSCVSGIAETRMIKRTIVEEVVR